MAGRHSAITLLLDPVWFLQESEMGIVQYICIVLLVVLIGYVVWKKKQG